MFVSENLDTVYIISYLAENEEKFKVRSKAMKKQAEWLINISQIKEVNYFAQMWPEWLIKEIKDIYNKNSNITLNLEIFSEKVYTSIARNKNMKKFYKSNKEIALFLDDDVLVETYNKENPMNIFDFYDNYLKNKVDFDIIGFKNSMYGNETKKRGIDCCLKPTIWQASSALLITHMKQEPYFDESYPALEDMDFGFQIAFNRCKYYCCFNPHLKENTAVSIMFKDTEDRKERNHKARLIAINKWNSKFPNLLKLSKNNRLIQKNFSIFKPKYKEIVINFKGE
jgi:hypothetical protein